MIGQRRSALLTALVAGLWLAGAGAPAQSLTGRWGSPLYQVDLQVSGSKVTGSFKFIDQPEAQPGTITGELKAGGKSFTAEWKFPGEAEGGSFSTLLELSSSGYQLNGYRWSEDSLPAVFSLHQAVDGQIPELIDETSLGDQPAPPATSSPSQPTPSTPQPTPSQPQPPVTTQPPVTETPAAGRPQVELIICENVDDGQPVRPGNEFTGTKTVVALVRYKNLPADSVVDWVWTLDGKPEARLNKTLTGNGWHVHGLRSETGLIPGNYLVEVSLNGALVAREEVGIRGRQQSAASPPERTPVARLTICEDAPEGNPQNVANVFTSPPRITCLVTYENQTPGTVIKWVWSRDGKQLFDGEREVKGNGWAWHAITNEKGLTPGNYEVVVTVNGQAAGRERIVVKGAQQSAAARTPKVRVIICDEAPEGNPRNVASTFTSPPRITCLVTYENQPAGTVIKWVWSRDGQQTFKHDKEVKDNGWAWHAITNEKGLTPGNYEVVVTVNGQAAGRERIVVKGAQQSAAARTPKVRVIICDEAPDGNPRNVASTFTSPPRITCLVTYENQPAGTVIKWVWSRDGQQTFKHDKEVKDNGWAWHAITNEKGLTPGNYEVVVTVNGQAAGRERIVVKGAQ